VRKLTKIADYGARGDQQGDVGQPSAHTRFELFRMRFHFPKNEAHHEKEDGERHDDDRHFVGNRIARARKGLPRHWIGKPEVDEGEHQRAKVDRPGCQSGEGQQIKECIARGFPGASGSHGYGKSRQALVVAPESGMNIFGRPAPIAQKAGQVVVRGPLALAASRNA
jgi:hypothetical protein